MKQKTIRIGLDFDGVVAYNPFRIVRAPVTFIKRNLLGFRKLKFYIPKTGPERFVWAVIHESSMFPAFGCELLKELSHRDNLEFHLVTARFHFLQGSVNRWLYRYGLTEVFSGVHLNKYDKQPHEHKLEMIRMLKLDYYVEDNWDIISFLTGKTNTEIFWIYNITDRGYPYPKKFPYLKKALEAMPL